MKILSVKVATCCFGDDILHFCTIQGVSDAFQGVAAPLTLVLMVDILTSTIYLAIEAFNGQALAALIFLAIAVIIMLLWTFCSVCYDLCNARMYKTKFKRVLVDIVIGVGGALYLIGDNLSQILELQNNLCQELVSNITGVQLMNVTCGQLLTSFSLGQLDDIPGVTIPNLLYGFSLATYAKVLIGFSVFLFSMFPTCVFKFNTQEEINDIVIEKEENFPVTFTLASLAVIVEINAWFAIIVTNPAQVCPLGEMIADFVIYGLFVIGWLIIVTVFLISDCRNADERKKKKPVKLYVIFTMIVLVPSLPIYLLANNDRPLSCVPNLRCVTDDDLGCDAVDRLRFGMLLVLSAFITLLTAFTAAGKLYLIYIQRFKITQKT